MVYINLHLFGRHLDRETDVGDWERISVDWVTSGVRFFFFSVDGFSVSLSDFHSNQ